VIFACTSDIARHIRRIYWGIQEEEEDEDESEEEEDVYFDPFNLEDDVLTESSQSLEVPQVDTGTLETSLGSRQTTVELPRSSLAEAILELGRTPLFVNPLPSMEQFKSDPNFKSS